MGYKLLGQVIWRGGRWYVRRRYGGTGRKVAVGVASAAVLGGVIAAGRAASSSDR